MKKYIAIATLAAGLSATAAYANDENVLDVYRAQSAAIAGEYVKTTPVAEVDREPSVALIREQAAENPADGTFAFRSMQLVADESADESAYAFETNR